ncbi:MAG: hypothetical protein ACLFRQ_05620 [Desulfonatronovibrio sp.]
MAKPETRIINKFENANFTDPRQKKKSRSSRGNRREHIMPGKQLSGHYPADDFPLMIKFRPPTR